MYARDRRGWERIRRMGSHITKKERRKEDELQQSTTSHLTSATATVQFDLVKNSKWQREHFVRIIPRANHSTKEPRGFVRWPSGLCGRTGEEIRFAGLRQNSEISRIQSLALQYRPPFSLCVSPTASLDPPATSIQHRPASTSSKFFHCPPIHSYVLVLPVPPSSFACSYGITHTSPSPNPNHSKSIRSGRPLRHQFQHRHRRGRRAQNR